MKDIGVVGIVSLTWGVSIEVETWAVSPRGAGWLFGDKVATEVCLFVSCFVLRLNLT